MIKKIRSVGTSLGVLLPTMELKKIGVDKGTSVQVLVRPDSILLLPLERKPDNRGTVSLALQDRRINPEFYQVLAQ